MAHDNAYLICENKCKVPGYSKEQIDELLKKGSLAVVDKNTGEEYGFWIGTTAEYEALSELDPKTIYIKKDEEIMRPKVIFSGDDYGSGVEISEPGFYIVEGNVPGEGAGNHPVTLMIYVPSLTGGIVSGSTEYVGTLNSSQKIARVVYGNYGSHKLYLCRRNVNNSDPSDDTTHSIRKILKF